MKKLGLIMLIFLGLIDTSCDKTHSVAVFTRTLFKTQQLEKRTAENERIKINYKYKIIESRRFVDTLGYPHRGIKVYCYGDSMTYFEVIPALPINIDLTSKPTVVNLTIVADTITLEPFKTATLLYSADKRSELGFKWKKLK